MRSAGRFTFRIIKTYLLRVVPLIDLLIVHTKMYFRGIFWHLKSSTAVEIYVVFYRIIIVYRVCCNGIYF